MGHGSGTFYEVRKKAVKSPVPRCRIHDSGLRQYRTLVKAPPLAPSRSRHRLLRQVAWLIYNQSQHVGSLKISTAFSFEFLLIRVYVDASSHRGDIPIRCTEMMEVADPCLLHLASQFRTKTCPHRQYRCQDFTLLSSPSS